MKPLVAAILATALSTTFAVADEISDTLLGAIEAYEEGDVQYALEEIAFAQQLLNELKSAALLEFLPEAPEGWTREIEDAQQIGMFMGGGTGVKAAYSDDGNRFSIAIMTDNPMVAAMSNMFANSAILSSQGKLVRVGREKFLDQNGDLTGMIDGRIMVQASGAETEVMVSLLELIDFRELGRFGF